MKNNYVTIMIILLLIFSGCTHEIVNDQKENSQTSKWPNTIETLLINDETTHESIQVHINEPKERLIFLLKQAKCIETPETFTPTYSLNMDNKKIYIQNDVFCIDNAYFLKENMEIIWSSYFNYPQFKYENALQSIKADINMIKLQWLEQGQPYMSVEWHDKDIESSIIEALMERKIQEGNPEFPLHSTFMLMDNHMPLLEYSQDRDIKIKNAIFKTDLTARLYDMLWDSDEAKNLFEGKITDTLIKGKPACQLKFNDGKTYLVPPEVSKTIADYLSFNKFIYGGMTRDDDPKPFELHINCGCLRNLRLAFIDSDTLEVNDCHFYIKYDSELWDYLCNKFPTN